jgi:hypothetical protein
MNQGSWYEITDGNSLLQGDLIAGCPVSRISREWSFPLKWENVIADVVAADLVVMTQSCDLENNKVSDVLLAQVISWPNMLREEIGRGNLSVKSRDFRKKLVEGNVPGTSLLHKHDMEPKLEWSVVNFHRLYTLPKSFLEQYAQSLGPRLRLLSPYREHLAQAFARYFMRVGLPHDAKEFEKEGDVAINP